MTKYPKSAADIAKSSSSLANFAKTATFLGKMQQKMQTYLPSQLAMQLQIINIRNNTLVISASGSVQANWLRLSQQEILRAAKTCISQNIDTVIVRIIPATRSSQTQKPKRSLSSRAKKHLEEVRGNFDSDITEMMEKMITRHE